jgi:hypothetical protein
LSDSALQAADSALSSRLTCVESNITADRAIAAAHVCAGGNFTATGSDAPCSSPCPAGAHCSFGVVHLCPPGSFNSLFGSASPDACRLCPPGRANAASGVAVCAACTVGRYSSSAGEWECALCSQGKYLSREEGNSSALCQLCPSVAPLSQAGSGSAAACESPRCSAGTYTPSDAASLGAPPCQAQCPQGAWCYNGVLSSCSAGRYGSSAGASSDAICLFCPAGSFSISPGAASCQPCPGGSFVDHSGAVQCDLCPPNTASSITAANSSAVCVACPPHSTAAAGSARCSVPPCGPGTFTPSGGAPCSESCPSGAYCLNADIQFCPPGRFSSQTGQSEPVTCQPCPAGSFSPSPGSASCQPCPSGQFVDHSGAVQCDLCPPNTASIAIAANSSTVCSVCSVFSAPTPAGSARCVVPECAPGTFTPSSGGVPCSQPCPIGAYCTGGEVHLCSPGRYSQSTGASDIAACLSCPPGRASASSGIGTCSLCVPGSYSGAPGALECSLCIAGTFQPETGAQSPLECQICPSYAPESVAGTAHSSDCFLTPCTDGFFTDSSDPALSCAAHCPTGGYCDDGVFVPCPPAHFNGERGGSSIADCKVCPPGTANAYAGAMSCAHCAPGFYSANSSSSFCTACPINTYNSLSGATDLDYCIPCPADTPVSGAASANVYQCSTGIVCTPGTYTPPSATSVCSVPCPVGSRCQGGQETLCEPGTFSNHTGAALCTPCGAGWVGVSGVRGSTSASDCTACPASTYSTAAVSVSCSPCPPGRFSNVSASVSEASCLSLPDVICVSAVALIASDTLAGQLCPLAASQPLLMLPLLPGALAQMQSFIKAGSDAADTDTGSISAHSAHSRSAIDLPLVQHNERLSKVAGDIDAKAELLVYRAYASYVPLSIAPSLRIATFGSDAVLRQFNAEDSALYSASSATSRENASDDALMNRTAQIILIICLLSVSFVLPILFFRCLSARAVRVTDLFKLKGTVNEGEAVRSRPTQLGAATSLTFLGCASLVVILLFTQSNTLSTWQLLPPSAVAQANTARAHFQVTMRAYSGESSTVMAKWCRADTTLSRAALLRDSSGFDSSMQLRAVPQGQACAIAVDCAGCRITALAGMKLSFPASVQLVEFELWVSSAAPSVWSRRYGVLAQLPGQLLPAQTDLSFLLTEAFYVDQRSALYSRGASKRDDAHGSGYELHFLQAHPAQLQLLSNYSARSTVAVSLTLQRSDVILLSSLRDQQSPLQLLTLIASAVGSIFTLAAILFRQIDGRMRRRQISVGEASQLDEREKQIAQGQHGCSSSDSAADPEHASASLSEAGDASHPQVSVARLPRDIARPSSPSEIRTRSEKSEFIAAQQQQDQQQRNAQQSAAPLLAQQPSAASSPHSAHHHSSSRHHHARTKMHVSPPPQGSSRRARGRQVADAADGHSDGAVHVNVDQSDSARLELEGEHAGSDSALQATSLRDNTQMHTLARASSVALAPLTVSLPVPGQARPSSAGSAPAASVLPPAWSSPAASVLASSEVGVAAVTAQSPRAPALLKPVLARPRLPATLPGPTRTQPHDQLAQQSPAPALGAVIIPADDRPSAAPTPREAKADAEAE